MITRREFLRIAGLAAAWPYAPAHAAGGVVNDIHSGLNATRVHRIVEPETLDAARNTISAARRERRAVCIAGGRHAMGAQAFATDGVLIDIGIRHGGSYFPTYHKYATRKQVETCYPQFAEFLKLKRRYDPGEVFQSDWYRHYRKMFAS